MDVSVDDFVLVDNALSNVGNNLRDFRNMLGYTREEFLSIIDKRKKYISVERLSGIENGKQRATADLIYLISLKWPEYALSLISGSLYPTDEISPRAPNEKNIINYEEKLKIYTNEVVFKNLPAKEKRVFATMCFEIIKNPKKSAKKFEIRERDMSYIYYQLAILKKPPEKLYYLVINSLLNKRKYFEYFER